MLLLWKLSKSHYSNFVKHKQWLSYSKNTGHSEGTFVLDFLITLVDKGCAHSTVNCAKWAVPIIVHILPYSSFSKHYQWIYGHYIQFSTISGTIEFCMGYIDILVF